MKRLVCLLGAAACAGRAKPPEGVIPVAKAITIYSAGGSVVSGVIDPAALHGRRLRLPPTVAAINLAQGDQSLPWFTVQAMQEVTNYKLVGLPALMPGALMFNYALPDITWTLRLVAEITDPKSVTLQLLAGITMNASEPYEKCDVTLVLNNAVSVEKASRSAFKLSAFDLYPHRNVTYNLGNKVADYSLIREWNAYQGKDEVHVLVQVKNPFTVDLDQINSTVEAGQIIVEAGTIKNQGSLISLPAGTDDTIATFRSVKITEATDKRLLPFNHHVAYEVSNQSDQKKTLRLVTQRVMGTEHRSVYHFTQKPDATPENTLVWLLELEPNSTRTLEFDFDADVKDVEGENGFEQGG